MAAGRQIKISFVGDSSSLNKATAEAEKATGRFSERTQKFAKVAMAGVAAVGIGLAAGLKAGVQGLQEGEEAEARFADATSRIPKAVKINTAAFQDYAEAVQRSTRFTYEDTLAVGTMLAAQDGVQKAIKGGTVTLETASATVLDLATAQGVDAPAAAKTYAKAMAAPEKAAALLRKAGINLTDAQQQQIKKMVEAGDVAGAQGIIQDELRAKFEGAAKAAGETTAGQMERAKNAFGEVQEQLAVGLIPVITDLLGYLVRVTSWAQDNPGKVKVAVIVLGSLAAVIGAVSLAITTWTAITRVATAVQAAWNVVMAANPIVLVTLAVIALVAAIVLIATKTTWFQQIWKAAFGAIKTAVAGVFSWVQANWPLLLAILTGPIGLAVLAVVKNFDKIKAAAMAVKDGIATAFGKVADIITKPFTAAVSAIKSAWNSTIGGRGISIPEMNLGFTKIGGGSFTIPMLAGGGIARGGAMHIVGERGPELFVPGRTGRVVPNDELGGDYVVEIHGRGDNSVLEALIDKVVVRRGRGTRRAVVAGAGRAF